MQFQPKEVALLRRAHMRVKTGAKKTKSRSVRVGEAAFSLLFVGLVSTLVLLLERELNSSVVVGALWAAPMALLTRSLSLTIVGAVVVCIAFGFGSLLGHPRGLTDIAVFISSGVLFMLASSVMYARFNAQRLSDRREREILGSAYAAVMCAIDNSNELVVWLDDENDWIYCNLAALLATGVSRISVLTDIEGRAENEALMGMMHSGSRDAWRRLVEILSSMRTAGGDGDIDSLSPNSRLFGPVYDGNIIDTRIKLTDALGVSSIFDLRVTMLEGEGAMVHGKRVAAA